HDLHHDRYDAQQDDDGTDPGHDHQRLPFGLLVGLHTTHGTKEAQCVERHEGEIEADQPAPEGALAPFFIQLEAERFREPVAEAGQHTKHHAADDDVVEVGDDEKTVVQHEVRPWYGQHDASHAT